MTESTIDGPQVQLERDHYGRPKVVPPNGGKPTPYTRCTTFVDCLDDKYNLQRWQQRMVALGVADRPDLVLAVLASRGKPKQEQKQELDGITTKAMDAAQAGAAVTTGSAVHSLTELIDRGEELPTIPEAYQADLDAYRRETRDLHPVLLEQFTVLDDYKVGGTPDRVVSYQGRGYIADVKTGSIDFGAMKIAMQLAVYARSTPYDPATQTRGTYPIEVDQDWGIVIHLPAGEGRCELRWVDLQVGWSAVEIASKVRYWRSYKGWYQPFEVAAVEDATSFDPVEDTFFDQIADAVTVTELREVHARANAAGAYTDELHAACLARKDTIEGAA